MTTTVKERLSAYLDYKKVNKSEFGRRIGVSNAFVSSIRKSIQPDKILAIKLNFPDLNTDWLLTGEGEMLNNNAKLIGGVYVAGSDDDLAIMVDFVPVSARASFIENLYTPTCNDLDRIPLIPRTGEREQIESLKIFEVEGDSMLPKISNGALILASEIPAAKWHTADKVVVVVFSEFVVIKRVQQNNLQSGNTMTLSSDNTKFGTMTIVRSDIRAIYRAKRIISEDIQ